MKSFALLATALACASAFAPGAVLPSTGRNTVAFGPTMQRLGSTRSVGSSPGGGGTQKSTAPSNAPSGPRLGSIGSLGGSLAGGLGSLFKKGAEAPAPPAGTGTQRPKAGSQLVTPKKAAPAPKKAAPAPKAAPAARAPPPARTQPVRPAAPATGSRMLSAESFFQQPGFNGQGRFVYQSGNRWDDEGADWARDGGIFGRIGNVIWAREAEVKHGRVCMLAATGAIVQDLYTFPFMDKWYNGEKMWGLHEAAIKSGAMWQVLFFIGLLEMPYLVKLREGSIDGTGDLAFDPAGIKENQETFYKNQVREIKNGRLAMIAISGMTHHYFLTGKGPIEFMTQIPNFKSCTLAAVNTGLCR